VAALGGVIAVKSAESGLDGFHATIGPYQSTEGQRVADSFSPETYPGDRDRAAELGKEGAGAVLGFGLGKLAGRLASGQAPVTGETTVAATATKAESVPPSAGGKYSNRIDVASRRAEDVNAEFGPGWKPPY
jgi:hypothetical protein